MKAKITERALIARIRRALQNQGQDLRTARDGSRSYEEFGRHYVIGPSWIERTDVDLRKLAVELGCLAPWEEVD